MTIFDPRQIHKSDLLKAQEELAARETQDFIDEWNRGCDAADTERPAVLEYLRRRGRRDV